MDPTNRVLLQVSLDDAATADELFSVLTGEDVESRRSFITRNAKDLRFLDVSPPRRARNRYSVPEARVTIWKTG